MNFPLHLFEGYGVELEYMIVDKESLKVNPVADKVIYEIAGEYLSEIELGDINWSNELVLHVIELKTNGPISSIQNLDLIFQEHVQHINRILNKYDSKLLPTGIHPFMDPFTETYLWPHENNPVYETYNRIFDCRGHGWSNLQSLHLNLPFGNDEEFGRLHAAIRLLLPIIPALSASTPIINGNPSGMLDTRLDVYRNNQNKIPSLTGRVIPERAFTKNDYEKLIFKKIYSDIEPYDPDNILKYEWLNSRGAIARFDRNTIEIRIIDSQECPLAELALTFAIDRVIRGIIEEKWIVYEKQNEWDEHILSDILMNNIKEGENTIIENKNYLEAFGYKKKKCSSKELWIHLLEDEMANMGGTNKRFIEPLKLILEQGTLASRILKTLKNDFSRQNILKIYHRLSGCLENGKMFTAL